MILHLIIKNILACGGLSCFAKIKTLFKTGFLLSLPAWFIEEAFSWYISNQDYITGVLACIAIDHMVGSVYHAFRLHDFTFRKNITGLIYKLSLCTGAAILFEVIQNTVKDVSFIYDYLKIITRLIIILYPAGSAFINMSALTNGVFPPAGWIKRLITFNENIDLEKLLGNGQTKPGENKAFTSQNKAGNTGSL